MVAPDLFTDSSVAALVDVQKSYFLALDYLFDLWRRRAPRAAAVRAVSFEISSI